MEMTEVLNNIRRAREAKGMSQTDMGILLDLDQSSYSLVESGSRGLTLDRLLQIAEILEVPVQKLLMPQGAQYNMPDINRTWEDALKDPRYGGPKIRLDLLDMEIERLKKERDTLKEVVRKLEEEGE